MWSGIDVTLFGRTHGRSSISPIRMPGSVSERNRAISASVLEVSDGHPWGKINRTIQEEFIDYHEELLITTDESNPQLIPWLIWYNAEWT